MEKLSGKYTNRPEFLKMLDYLSERETLYVKSISCFSRSIRDLLKTIDILTEKGVIFVSQKENIDAKMVQGRFMLSVFAALSELGIQANASKAERRNFYCKSKRKIQSQIVYQSGCG